ncbi:MAG: hypothetical protein AAGL89_04690 [Pseudomonadota bacterium]
MLSALIAAVMAASFFLPWMEFFGETMSPVMIFDQDVPWGDMPWQFYAFLASFALAALGALLALIRQPAGVIMLVAGAIPFGLIGQQVLAARDQVQDLGLPMPGGGDPEDLINNFDVIQEFIGIGLYAYFGAAALLVLFGLGRLLRGA